MAVCERCGKDAGVVTVGRMSLCAGCGASAPHPAMAPPGPPGVPAPPRQGPPPGPTPQDVSWGEPPPAQTPGPAEWAPQPGAPPAWVPVYGPPPKKKRSAVAIVFIVLGVVVAAVVGAGVVLAIAQSEDDKDAAEAVDDFSEGATETFAYTPPDGSFTIEFPEEPRSDNLTQPIAETDADFTIHMAVARVGRLNVFQAGYSEYPPEFQLDPQGALDSAVAGGVAENDGTLLRDDETTVGFLPARSFAVRYDDPGAGVELVANALVVSAGQRLYVVSVTTEDGAREVFDEFIASFEILT